MRLAGVPVFIIVLITAHSVSGSEQDAVLGSWVTEDGKGVIELYECSGRVFGKIVSLSEPCFPPDDERGMGGKPRIDRNNPDPNLQNRPVKGLVILRDFVCAGTRIWQGGEIYDPENGKTYRGRMKLLDPDRLQLRGYIGIPLLGRSTVWERKQ